MYVSHKSEFFGWKRSKRIASRTSALLSFNQLKPPIKRMKNIDLLNELPFYDESSIGNISEAFKRYARTFKVEIGGSKDPLAQLEASKPSIKDYVFEDLLDEIKNPERMTKSDKNMVNDLDYESIEFPVSGKDFGKIGKGNNICINVFCYENNLVFSLFIYQIKNLKSVWIINNNKWK